MSATLDSLCLDLDHILRHREMGDYPGAQNGRHLQNSGVIRQLACAVDANLPVILQASREPSTLLIVHHGLAWDGLCPLTGGLYQMIRSALESDLAVFSSHLPLDAHPQFGNNILLTRALGIENHQPALELFGSPIARLAEESIPRNELILRMANALKILPESIQCIAAGPEISRRILVCSGSGRSLLEKCADLKVDTLITGEVTHESFSKAHALGLNIILGGHYATETLGVQAITRHLADRHGLPWRFVDVPSGL
ncbi:MAG: Nif3-like dinuclear metal center hexameric protein [Candidatus Methylacidiphilales bacterium]